MAAGTTANSTGQLPQLVANGKWLTTTDGEVVILRGVNLVSKTSKTPEELGFDESNAQLLADRGFSVVRLGVLWCNVEPYLKSGWPAQRVRRELSCESQADHRAALAPRHLHAG